MKLRIILTLTFFTLVTTVSAQKSEYIGYQHKGVLFGETLSNGAKDLGGSLLSNNNFGVSRFSKGKRQMLWLEKIASRDAKGIPGWVVKDVLTFDNFKKNQEFLLPYGSNCTQNSKESLDLIVRAEFSARTKKYKVLDAWKANLKKEKFEKLPAKSVKCEFVAPMSSQK